MAKRSPRKSSPKKRSHGRENRVPSPGRGSSTEGIDRLFWWIFPALAAVVVITVLLPGEGVAREGDGVLMAAGWIFLGLLWSMLALLRWRSRGTVMEFQAHSERFHSPSFSGQAPGGRFDFTPLDGVFYFLIAWIVIASLVALGTGAPRPAMNMLWVWVAMGVAWFLFRRMLIHPIVLRALVTLGIALAVAQAGFGLYQFFVEMPRLRAEYAQDPDAMLRESGLWFPEGSPERLLFEERLKSVEPMGTFALTNSLAGLLTPWTVLLFGLLLLFLLKRNREQDRFDRLSRLLRLAIPMLPLLLCLLLTKSRSAWLAVLLGLSAIAAVLLVRGGVSRFGGRRLAAVVLVLLVGLAVMIGVGIQWGGIDREIVTEAYKSLGYRLQYWQATMGIIADHPWFGCGPGNFQHVYTQYKLPTASEEIADPHNFLLHFWSIAGTPAALAMVVFLVLLVRVAVRGHGKPTRAEAAFGNASSAPPRETVAASRLAPLSGWMVATGAGFFLAVMLSQSASVPLGIEVIMIGMPVAWSAFWLLWPVVRDLEIPPWMLLVAVLALFVNLSAAGGIHFPNVAISAWLLAAMVVFAASRRPPGDATSTTTLGDQVPEPERDRRQGRNLVVTLIGMMVLGAVFYHYEFYPVLKWRACQNAAMRTPDAKERWTYLLQAVKADPWATETWLTLATMMPSTEGGGPEAAEPRTYRRRALMTAPHSAHVRLQLGEAAMQYYSRTGDRETLALAERMFTEAIERYPTSAALHAKKAVAQYLLGKKSAARAAREKAWELDERTPHADQKLTPPLRRQLESLELGDRAAGEAEREAG